MQLMLVYRFMRQENVPQDGPIILAATHHNEIIDIAALSVTIPYRRRIRYWAKSTLFKNPFSGALLRSSRCIPVYRNPNTIGNHNGPATTSQTELFKHTSMALASGEVIGVFPEGTSYTEPAIAQVKEGAAWAAIEYVKAVAARSMGEAEKDLLIVPTAIVYTDKSQYQSRVLVRYGKLIRVRDFLTELNLEDGGSIRGAVKEITAEIYQRLREMTINAPDWDTYNSVKIATEASCGKDLSLHKYIRISQTLVELLSDESEEIRTMKLSLVKYLGLLHYTGISRAALDYLYPLPGAIASPSSTNIPTIPIAAIAVLFQLCKTFLHPSAIAFLPMFVVHIPAYITGWLAARFLPKRDEEEAKAQYKVIFGGLGVGLSYGMVIRMVFNACMRLGDENRTTWLLEILPPFFVTAIGIPLQRLLPKEGGVPGFVRQVIGTMAVTVGTVRILWKWHNSLVRGNLERWRCLSASVKILIGLISPTSNDLSDEGLVAYSRPPPPAESIFIKQRTPTKIIKSPPISTERLIRPLFFARMDAVGVVRKLEGMQEGRRVETTRPAKKRVVTKQEGTLAP